MTIKSAEEYIEFFVNLNMKNVPLWSFVNNEKMILRQKSGHKNLEKKPIMRGIEILDKLTAEINQIGQEAVLAKYHT